MGATTIWAMADRKKFVNCSSSMAIWSCMKKSSGPVPATKTDPQEQTADPAELEFPVAPDFVSRPPRLDPQLMLKRCAETMPWRSSRPGERARRLAEKIPVEFVL